MIMGPTYIFHSPKTLTTVVVAYAFRQILHGRKIEVIRKSSGVAGPLAAQGGGQICRPFVFLGRPFASFAAKDPT